MRVETVHIIEDDPSVRSALVNLIESEGLAACASASVDDFSDRGDDVSAGCFLVDVRLPGLNGLDFLKSMAERGLRLPVILITGYGDIPMTVRGMRAGAVDFLTKPFRDREVLDAVSRALLVDRERRIEEQGRLDMVTRYESLTKREREVMMRVTAGKMNKQVAGDLGLSEITVKLHRGTLMRKMGVRTLADLVKVSEHLGPQMRVLESVGP